MIGLESWFYNFSQLSRRWNSPDTLADIPRPYLELSIWGALKGGEIMSVLGGLFAHPIYRLYLKKQLTPENTTPNSHKIIRNKCRRLQVVLTICSNMTGITYLQTPQCQKGRFLLAGLFAGPALAALYSTQHSEDHIRRLCYSVRCDQPAMVYDRMAFVCGFIGWYWKRFQGAVDGINIGLAYTVFNNHVLAPNTSPLLVDKVKPEEQYKSLEEAQKNKSKLTRFLMELDEKAQNEIRE